MASKTARKKAKRVKGLWGTFNEYTHFVAESIYRAPVGGITMSQIVAKGNLDNTYHCVCDKFKAKGFIYIDKIQGQKVFTPTEKGQIEGERYFLPPEERGIDIDEEIILESGPQHIIDFDLPEVELPNEYGDFVYFAQEKKEPYPIKIGKTCYLKVRLCELQTGNPNKIALVCYVYAANNAVQETVLHRQFAGQRLRREWFLPNEAMIKTIGRYKRLCRNREV